MPWAAKESAVSRDLKMSLDIHFDGFLSPSRAGEPLLGRGAEGFYGETVPGQASTQNAAQHRLAEEGQ